MYELNLIVKLLKEHRKDIIITIINYNTKET